MFELTAKRQRCVPAVNRAIARAWNIALLCECVRENEMAYIAVAQLIY